MRSKNKWSNKTTLIMLILMAITSVLMIWARSSLVNGDTAWHITLGEWILDNGYVPKVDVFSQSTVIDGKTLNFLSHQWLTDILFAVTHSIGSMNMLYALMIFSIFVGHIMVIKANKGNDRIVAAAMLIAFSAVGFHKDLWITPDTIAAILMLGVNLHLVSWIKSECSTRKKNFKKVILINAGLILLMANMHGGMLSANLIVQTVTLGGYTILCTGNKKERLIQALSIIGSTFVCGLLNPHGINIYKYGFMMSSTAAEYLDDWETFSFDNAGQICVVGIIVLAMIIGIVKQIQTNNTEKDKGILINTKLDILLLCMFAAMLFRYKRTLNVFTLAMALYAAKYVYIAFNDIWLKIKQKRRKLITKSAIALFILSAFVINISILNNKPERNQTIQEYASSFISPAMVDYIKNDDDQKKIFNTIESGGFLICLGISPFIDGRTDPYLSEYGNQDLFTKSVKAVHSIDIMEELTVSENIDCLILRKNAISSQILFASDNWEVREESELAVMFTRKEK